MARSRIAAAATLALGLSACAGLLPGTGPSPSPTPAGGATTSLDQTACADMAGKKTAAITAATNAASGSAPALGGDHTRNDLKIPGSGAGRYGYVKFESPAKGAWVVYHSKKVDLKAYDSGAKAVAIETSRPQPSPCEDVKAIHKVALDAGTYLFEVGPATNDFWIVVLQATP